MLSSKALSLPLLAFLALSSLAIADNESICYGTTLPPLPSSVAAENRTTPWGSPSLILPNGTTCCASLDQVRAGIDVVDDQLLELLALRAGYVKEATRFKATLDSVDVPSQDEAVIQGAVDTANTTTPPLPAAIAKAVFEAIINSSVPFEKCVFGEYCDAT